MRPLRCHLLIGPPASGKTTLGRQLAPLLTHPGAEPARLLSTDRLRAELFGDAAVPRSVEAVVHGLQTLLGRGLLEPDGSDGLRLSTTAPVPASAPR